MYNMIEYSWNYSEKTGNLWFYSNDEVTTSDADITTNNNFESFMNKAKVFGNTAASANNWI